MEACHKLATVSLKLRLSPHEAGTAAQVRLGAKLELELEASKPEPEAATTPRRLQPQGQAQALQATRHHPEVGWPHCQWHLALAAEPVDPPWFQLDWQGPGPEHGSGTA